MPTLCYLIALLVPLSTHVFAEIKEDVIKDNTLFSQTILSELSKDPNYFYELGNVYYKTKNWVKAIEAYRHVLQLQSENQDAQVKLGYALLFLNRSKEDLLESKRQFEKVIKVNPEYKDAQDGLARVEVLLQPPPEKPAPVAEKKEVKETPKQPTWEEITVETAANLLKKGYHWAAIDLYIQLVDAYPKNADYFFNLGQAYVRVDCRCLAVRFFEQALALKPDHSDALVALGNQYLYFDCPKIAQIYFAEAVELAPNNVYAWLGYAKAEVLLDNPVFAEGLFTEALYLEPENLDVVIPYAGFLYDRKRFSESLELYSFIEFQNQDPCLSYIPTLFEISAFTRPTFWARVGATEEREKEFFSGRWVASLRYLNADAGVIYPINDFFRISGRFHDGNITQHLIISDTNQFSYNSISEGARGEWFYNPYWTFVGDLNIEWVSNADKDALLATRENVLVEPSVLFRYKGRDFFFNFGETTDSIFFRDFEDSRLLVVTREALAFWYQHDFGDYRFFGTDAAWLFYNDPIHNQEQDLNGWVQAGFPYFEEYLSVRYHAEYRRFNKETTGYYSFEYQLTHWLKFRLFKKWLCGQRCELEYWHGWRTTRGRNPQNQIIISPIPQLLPVITVESQIDFVNLTLGYTPTECYDFWLAGSYYHDSFDYTVWSIRAQIDWRF